MSNSTVEMPGERPNGVSGLGQSMQASPRRKVAPRDALRYGLEVGARGQVIVVVYLVVVLVLGIIALSRVPAQYIPQLVLELEGWLRL
jgi:hypothetical protein